MAITVKKKSLKMKSKDSAPEASEASKDLNDLPDISESSNPPVAVMGGSAPKKKSGEYLVTGIFGLLALVIMIGVIVLQYNELEFYKDVFYR